jgi:hypothetical protein
VPSEPEEVHAAMVCAGTAGGIGMEGWRTYYGAELKRIQDLVGRFREQEQAAG